MLPHRHDVLQRVVLEGGLSRNPNALQTLRREGESCEREGASGCPSPPREECEAAKAKSLAVLRGRTMLHLSDRDGNAFCGAQGGDRTFEYQRIDCPDCIRMIREGERQDRRNESGGG